MNNDNSYFKKALSDFAFDVAYGDSIKHLYESGYSPQDIKKHLQSSLTTEQITSVISKYKERGEIQENQGSVNNNISYYTYEKVYDEYGHASFIRKKHNHSD